MYCFIYLKVLRVDTKIKSRLFADRLIVSILFRCKWFSIILLRWHDWKISKQSSNQFLMLQKNCLKFSFDTYRYTYIISSFVFRHTIPGRYIQLVFFVRNPSNFFIFSFLHKFSCAIFCFDTHLWLVAENYRIYPFKYFFLYHFLKIKEIFFFLQNKQFILFSRSLVVDQKHALPVYLLILSSEVICLIFFFFSSYCTVIACRLWSILYLLHKDMIFHNFQYFWSLINFFFI